MRMPDFDAPLPNQFVGESVHTVTVLEFVRVEPFSNLLTFFGVVGAALMAVATLALAVVTWIG
jgi:hypothetical protein